MPTNAEVMVDYALSQLGSPYVFGARGQKCTPSYRDGISASTKAAHPTIVSKCQVLTGKSESCSGCSFSGKLCFDCRGLTYCAAKAAGLSLIGAGCTSQWNKESNWAEKGTIDKMPKNKVCILMRANGSTMEHTALYLGDGTFVEAGVGVRQRSLSAGKFTHYGRLVNMDKETSSMQNTVKYGSKGSSVTELQQALVKLGYTLSVDGSFGNETLTVLKKYQSTNGLEVDGICGSVTWSSINTALGKIETNTETEDTDVDETLEARVASLEARVTKLEG